MKFTAGYIKCNWNKWNSPIVIKGLIDRPLFNSSMVDSAILEIANALQDGIYSDTAFEFTLGEFTAIDYKG